MPKLPEIINTLDDAPIPHAQMVATYEDDEDNYKSTAEKKPSKPELVPVNPPLPPDLVVSSGLKKNNAPRMQAQQNEHVEPCLGVDVSITLHEVGEERGTVAATSFPDLESSRDILTKNYDCQQRVCHQDQLLLLSYPPAHLYRSLKYRRPSSKIHVPCN